MADVSLKKTPMPTRSPADRRRDFAEVATGYTAEQAKMELIARVESEARHDLAQKLDELETVVPQMLKAVHDGLYEKALARRESMTYTVTDFDELKETADQKPGLIKAMWCGDLACEMKLKEEAGVTSRCMPFEQEELAETCVCCGKPAKKMVYWGKAY